MSSSEEESWKNPTIFHREKSLIKLEKWMFGEQIRERLAGWGCLTRYKRPRNPECFLRSISSKKQHRMHVCWENDVVLLLSDVLAEKSVGNDLPPKPRENCVSGYGANMRGNARKIQHPSMLHNGKWALEYWWFFSSFCAMIFSSHLLMPPSKTKLNNTCA